MLTSAALLSIWAQYVACGAMTRVTNLTFVPQSLTWNDANEVCHELGGHLVHVRSQTKQNMVIHTWKNLISNLGTEGDYTPISIGLARLTRDSEEYFWTDTCDLMGWWGWDERWLNGFEPGRQCVKINKMSEHWSLADCSGRRQFMCEQVTDEKCPYEAVQDVGLVTDGSEVNVTSHVCNVTECQLQCDMSQRLDGVECWAYRVDTTNECSLYFTEKPYMLLNATLRTAVSGTLYIKKCFHGIFGQPYYLWHEPNVATEAQICRNQTTQTTFALSTESTEMIKPSYDTVLNIYNFPEISPTEVLSSSGSPLPSSDSIFSTSVVISGSEMATIDQLTTETVVKAGPSIVTEAQIARNQTTQTTFVLSMESTEMINPSYDTVVNIHNFPEISMTEVLLPSGSPLPSSDCIFSTSLLIPGSEMVTIDQLTTKTVVKAGPSIVTFSKVSRGKPSSIVSTPAITGSPAAPVCHCPCHGLKNADERQRFLNQVIGNLTINKTELSSERRKYISVYDNRPVAIGIGCSGLVALVVVLAIIVVCDSVTFCLQNRN